MILKKRIPEEFYKLFRTGNRDAYMLFLVRLYEENNEAWGLTEEEGRLVIGEIMGRTQMVWEEDMAEQESVLPGISSGAILERLIRWGWVKRDFDDRLNRNVLSFPEYSRLYIELFQKLQKEEDGRERESMLSIYSALFTYHSDREKNHDMLKSALSASRNLNLLLSNMQDGMRRYFDELSGQKSFIGIQEVLVDEINNNDSQKYAILTTTDSFYRYKESVKELIGQILNENDIQQDRLRQEEKRNEDNAQKVLRIGRALSFCEETKDFVYQIEREFDQIERRYNKLIEQKAVFARRALARIHYILQEGGGEEDKLLQLVNLLGQDDRKEEICRELRERMQFTARFRNLSADSLYSRREGTERTFVPVVPHAQREAAEEITDFIPAPLYTRKQLQDFKKKNMQDGVFVAGEQTVQSAEDLEKLLFLWQEATNHSDGKEIVTLGEELKTAEGFSFSALRILEEEDV